MSFWSRIIYVFRGDHLNREIDEEFAAHMEEAIAAGDDPTEVRRTFGSQLRLREQSREARISGWLDCLRADLVFGWRQATFTKDQHTEVEVRFEAVGEETRVTVEHRGWDSVPQNHVARHTFPDTLFLERHGQWWRLLLGELKKRAA